MLLRKLILSDVARHVTQEPLINQTVFDLDETVRLRSAQHQTETGGTLTLEGCSPTCQDGADVRACSVGSGTSCRTGGLEQRQLRFESRFESGNLRKAIQVQ